MTKTSHKQRFVCFTAQDSNQADLIFTHYKIDI